MSRSDFGSARARGRGARFLLALVLVSMLALVPSAAGADSSGGSSFAYGGHRQDMFGNSPAFAPFLPNNVDGMSGRVIIRNEETVPVNVTIDLRPIGTGTERPSGGPVNLAAKASTEIAVSQFLRVREGVAYAAQANALTGTTTVAGTPVPARAAQISMVSVIDSGTTDTVALEGAVRPARDIYAIGHKQDNGFNSTFYVQNSGLAGDVTFRYRFRGVPPPPQTAEGVGFSAAQATPDQSAIVRAGASVQLDTSSAPNGAFSVEVEANSDRLILAVFHSNANGMTGAALGIAKDTGERLVSLALLFRKAGNQNAYTSNVWVLNVSDGSLQPRVTFYERDTGLKIGPIRGNVLSEGEAMVWMLDRVPGLEDGKVYSAEIEPEVGSTRGLAAVAGHLNVIRNTLATFTGVADDARRDESLPLVYKNVNGTNSGLQIKNRRSGASTVRVEIFNFSNGTRVATLNIPIDGSSSATLYMPNVEISAGRPLPDGTYSAEISGGDTVTVVNNVRYAG